MSLYQDSRINTPEAGAFFLGANAEKSVCQKEDSIYRLNGQILFSRKWGADVQRGAVLVCRGYDRATIGRQSEAPDINLVSDRATSPLL
ncbi:MAG: hypothetical protein AMXMBFR16_12840 [Candidatus Uhrbacteria bacterium]